MAIQNENEYYSGTSVKDYESDPESVAADTRRNGKGVASVIVGILALLLCLIPFVNVLGIILGLVAVGLGVSAVRKKLSPKGLSVTGIVIGSLATLVSIAVLGISLFVLSAIQPQLDRAGLSFDDIAQQVQSGKDPQSVLDEAKRTLDTAANVQKELEGSGVSMDSIVKDLGSGKDPQAIIDDAKTKVDTGAIRKDLEDAGVPVDDVVKDLKSGASVEDVMKEFGSDVSVDDVIDKSKSRDAVDKALKDLNVEGAVANEMSKDQNPQSVIKGKDTAAIRSNLKDAGVPVDSIVQDLQSGKDPQDVMNSLDAETLRKIKAEVGYAQ